MTYFHQSRGWYRDLSAKNVAICGVEIKDFCLAWSVQAHNTGSGISQLEYGSQVFYTKRGFSSSSNTSGALPAVLARRAPEVYEDEERTNRDALGYLLLCNAFLWGFHCAGTICQHSRIQGEIFHRGRHLLCMTTMCLSGVIEEMLGYKSWKPPWAF